MTFKPGKNQISLLSATVGLRVCCVIFVLGDNTYALSTDFSSVTQNYGAFYDNTPVGIVGGPVKLIGKNNTILDLSESNWSYKVSSKASILVPFILFSTSFVLINTNLTIRLA